MGWVKDNVIDPITGKSAADAARTSAELQAQAGREAIAEQRAARVEAREILQPFVDVGAPALAGAQDITREQLTLPGQLTPLGEVTQPELVGLAQRLSPEILQTGLGQQLQQEALQTGAAQQLLGEVTGLTGALDPSVLADPAFEAAQQEAAQRILASSAARGKEAAGQTQRALARESLLLGRQFAQQDLSNRLLAQQQRFAQLQAGLGLGTQEQAQRFQQLVQAGGLGQQEQAQRFGQLQQQAAMEAQAEQRELANLLDVQQQQFGQQNIAQQQALQNQIASRQQRFGELMQLAGIGQASAAGSAGGATQLGRDVAGTLTDIGAAQAAGVVGAAQARQKGLENLIKIGEAAVGAFG